MISSARLPNIASRKDSAKLAQCDRLNSRFLACISNTYRYEELVFHFHHYPSFPWPGTLKGLPNVPVLLFLRTVLGIIIQNFNVHPNNPNRGGELLQNSLQQKYHSSTNLPPSGSHLIESFQPLSSSGGQTQGFEILRPSEIPEIVGFSQIPDEIFGWSS